MRGSVTSSPKFWNSCISSFQAGANCRHVPVDCFPSLLSLLHLSECSKLTFSWIIDTSHGVKWLDTVLCTCQKNIAFRRGSTVLCRQAACEPTFLPYTIGTVGIFGSVSASWVYFSVNTLVFPIFTQFGGLCHSCWLNWTERADRYPTWTACCQSSISRNGLLVPSPSSHIHACCLCLWAWNEFQLEQSQPINIKNWTQSNQMFGLFS